MAPAIPLYRLCCILMWGSLMIAAPNVCGQDGRTVLRTGEGLTLQSGLVRFDQTPLLPEAELEFAFGFATDESFGPGQLFDSFSVSIQYAMGSSSAIYVTADSSGVVWVPVSPGNVSLQPEDVRAETIAFPDLDPARSLQFAYRVNAVLPSDVDGGALEVHFDLFDNQDPVGSEGWFGEVAIVPEPASGLLVLAGIISWLGIHKFRRL